MKRAFLIFSILLALAGCKYFDKPAKSSRSSSERHRNPMCIEMLPDLAKRPLKKPIHGPFFIITSDTDMRWPIGSEITVSFFGGNRKMKDKIFSTAKEWERYANIHFRRVKDFDSSAFITIGFIGGGSAYSQIGKWCFWETVKPVMNYGVGDDGLHPDSPDSLYNYYVLHEFGHALGLYHEHQHPNAKIPWDTSAVYAWYLQDTTWDSTMVFRFVISAVTDPVDYSMYRDPYSIMHYSIDSSLVRDKAYASPPNYELSDTDIYYIQQYYPFKRTNKTAIRTRNALFSETVI